MDADQVQLLHERIARLEAAVAALQRGYPAPAAAPGDPGVAPAPPVVPVALPGLPVTEVVQPPYPASPGAVPEPYADPLSPVVCPVCNRSAPAGQRFCAQCGSALPAPSLLPPPPPRPPTSRTAYPATPQPTRPLFTGLERLMTAEFWLNKIGVALLLFGLVFLFKYAVDRGWLTEPVRVAFGLLLGTVLLGAGLRLHRRHRHFAQVLLGGGIAAYYLTGFAAYQLFHLVPYWPAFGSMLAVTVLAFALALRLDGAVIALIGASGGLATPFLLYSAERNIPGLVAYTCLLLAGIVGAYLYRGWRSLLWLAWGGGWAVLLVARLSIPSNEPPAAYSERWAVLGGIVFAWLLFWLVPVLREVLSSRNPARWPRPALDWVADVFGKEMREAINAHVHVMTIVTPFLALLLAVRLWAEPQTTWGFVLLAGAGLYALAYGALRRVVPRLAYTHVMLAVVLLTGAWLLLLEGNVLLLTLAAQALTLLFFARRQADLGAALAGHLLFGGVGWVLAIRLESGHPGGWAIFNVSALTDLALIALAWAAATLVSPDRVAWLYRLVVYAALAGWLKRELEILPDGGGYVLIAWAALALALHYFAPRLEDPVTMPAAHFIFAATGAWLAAHLLFRAVPPPFLNVPALQDLIVLVLALTAAAFAQPRNLRLGYWLAVHGAVLAWFWRELVPVENGNAYITVAWGVYALALLAVSLVRDRQAVLLNFAIGTLFLVVGKLFLIDIVWLDPFWRILLFLGFGGLFLMISYYFQRLFRGPAVPPPGRVD